MLPPWHHCLYWSWSPGRGSVCQVSPLHSFYIALFGRKSLIYSPYLRKESTYINYLEFHIGGLFLLFHFLFNHLFLSLWTHGHLFYILGYIPILFYVIAWIVSILATESSFHLLLCPFDISPIMVFYFFFFKSTSLLSDTIRCSRLISSISWTSPRIDHFFRKLWFLLLGIVFRNQNLGTRCVCCHRMLFLGPQLRVRKYVD